VLSCASLVLLVLPVSGQTPEAKPEQKQTGPEQKQTEKEKTAAEPVQETGGRLVISGETVMVVAEPDAPPRSGSIATKIDTPLIETPRSVSIIERQTLDDLGAINIAQAHDYTVGVTPLDERGPGFARGFPVDFYDLRRDGLRTYAWSVREPAALERVQYLRGPSAVLYGDGSPGALVNLVLKKPLPVARYEVSGGAGGLGFGRLEGDVTGPLTRDKTIRYRFVAAGETLDNGFDNDERRFSVLPTFAFDIGSKTTVHVDTEYFQQRGRGYRHVVPVTPATQRGDFSGIPWDFNAFSPDDQWKGWNISPGVRIDAAINDRASVHIAARYTRIEGDLDFHPFLSLDGDGRTVQRYRYREISVWDEYQSDSFATYSTTTGSVQHRLVVGVEAGLSTTDSSFAVGSATPVDMFAPRYGSRDPIPAASTTNYDIGRFGFYALDQLRIAQSLIVVPAVRWSRIAIDNHVGPATVTDASSADGVFSPSIGLVYSARPFWSVYGTAARGFEAPPPGQYLEGGLPLQPMKSTSVEAGTKLDLLAQRLALTAAVYRIDRTNVAEATGRGFYEQIGEATSHGVEIEAVGRLAPGLGVRAGYAWMDTEVVSDLAGFVGNELPNAPPNKAELWLHYRVTDGMLNRLSGGFGLVYVADRFTGRDNVNIVPDYTRLDATASYDFGPHRPSLELVIQNLGNVRYAMSGNGVGLIAGAPRRIALQLRYLF
jgi:iron complex outermembrane receptor protein